MWQSSMLINLLVLSLEQIYVPIWVKHGSKYRGPITLLEPLVVLISHAWFGWLAVWLADNYKQNFYLNFFLFMANQNSSSTGPHPI